MLSHSESKDHLSKVVFPAEAERIQIFIESVLPNVRSQPLINAPLSSPTSAIRVPVRTGHLPVHFYAELRQDPYKVGLCVVRRNKTTKVCVDVCPSEFTSK